MIKVVKITKADFYGSPRIVQVKKIYYIFGKILRVTLLKSRIPQGILRVGLTATLSREPVLDGLVSICVSRFGARF